MAATRKLQGEIDRCLKKVTEGVETFEDIWQKVHNATNSNQKEKYEADLKKEIKKLQRLRDQIKSWIASGEIKDKSTLLEYRKLIETQMERFKVVERETKTKAYSKEGLGAAQKLDPAQKEREEIASWLVTSIGALNLQIDLFESEIESLLAGKKKRLDKDKQDRMEELKTKLDKHRYHIRKLETLLRMLDNMSVEVDQIRRIKEDVEYYIESSQDPDFEENEYIYDDIIGLDEVELSGVGLPSSATTDSNNSNETGGTPTSITSGASPVPSPSPAPSAPLINHSSDSSNEEKKKIKEEAPKPVKPTAVRATSAALNNSTPSILNISATQVSLNSSSSSIPGSKAPMLVSSTPSKPSSQPPPQQQNNTAGSPANHIPTSGNFAAVAASTIHNGPPPKHNTSHSVENGPLPHHAPASSASSASSGAGKTNSVVTGPSVNNIEHLTHNNCASPPSSVSSRASPPPSQGNTTPSPAQIVLNGPVNSSNKVPEGMSSLKSIAQQVIDRAGLELPNDSRTLFETSSSKAPTGTTSEALIPPLLGVAPLGAVPLQKEHQCQFQMMEAAFYHMPQPADSEKIRSYLPRNQCHTPPYYAQVQPVETPDFLAIYAEMQKRLKRLNLTN